MPRIYFTKILLFITALTISNFNLIQATASNQINSKLSGKLIVKNDIDTAPDIITLYCPRCNKSKPTRFLYLWRQNQQRKLKLLYDTSWQIQLNDGEIKKLADVIDRKAYKRGEGLYVKTSQLVSQSQQPPEMGYGGEGATMLSNNEVGGSITHLETTFEKLRKVLNASKDPQAIFNNQFQQVIDLMKDMEHTNDKMSRAILSNPNSNDYQQRAVKKVIEYINDARGAMLQLQQAPTHENFQNVQRVVKNTARNIGSFAQQFTVIEKNRTKFASLTSSKSDRSIHVKKVRTAFKNKFVANNKTGAY